MSDDLKARLRAGGHYLTSTPIHIEAANAMDQLEQRVVNLEEALGRNVRLSTHRP